MLLVLFTVAGGALRGNAAASPNRYQSADERAYARLARNLVRHHRYSAPEMSDPTHWAPGTPFFFAIAHRIHPRYPEHPIDVPAAYTAQAIVGTLQIPAAFALATLIAGSPAGLVAAGAIAVYPPLVKASGDLLSEPLGALMLTVALIAVVLALRRGGAWRACLAGVLLGLVVLVRADMLPIPFGIALLVAVVFWRRAGPKAGLRQGLVLLAAAVAVLAPWSAYASSQSGRFTPISSGGASNLYVGTFVPGDGSMFGVKKAWAERTIERYPELQGEPYWRIPQKKVIATIAAAYPGQDQESALRAAAIDNVRDYVIGDPLGFAALSWRKMKRMWLHYSLGTFGDLSTLTLVYHLLLVALSTAGILAAGLTRRRHAVELCPIVVSIVLLSAMNVILVSEARHNLPLMPVLVCGGAAGGAIAIQWLRERRHDVPPPEPTPAA